MNLLSLPILMSGFTTQAGIIVAVGAQNAFIIRQGIARSHMLPIIVICIAADLTLISVGTQGMGRIVTSHAAVLTALTWLGAAVLAAYGAMAFHRVLRRLHDMRHARVARRVVVPQSDGTVAIAQTSADVGPKVRVTTVMPEDQTDETSSLKSAIMQCLGFTFLNPGVYLDTVVLLGGIAATYGADFKWDFASGAMLCSVTWFTLLGLMSTKMSRLFRSDTAWVILDSVIGVTMVVLACHMVIH